MSRLLFALLIAIAIGGNIDRGYAQGKSVTFHFYGAMDCPPCMAFKRDGLQVVESAAARFGFSVAVNLTEYTKDVATPGTYGTADGLLRQAASKLQTVYPPIFFLTKQDVIVSVHGHDWRKALDQAIEQARS